MPRLTVRSLEPAPARKSEPTRLPPQPFLGLGIQPPTPSWGAILAVGRNYIASAWWIATLPGLCLFLLVLTVNLLGDRLRDRLDPRAVVR